jgi:Lon protease-like protein
MFEEAIEDDRLVALGVLAAGWEHDYEGRPPLRPTACLCRIATHQRTKEGTYNVLVLGVRRLRLVHELPPKKLFRVVEAEIVEESAAEDGPPGAAAALQQELLAAFKRAMPRIPNAYEQLDQLLGSQITLGMLADIVAYTIDLGLETKVQLLAESDVLRRARLLLEAIAARPPSRPRRPFPPDFSAN